METLLLEFKSRENNVIDFKVQDRVWEYTYHLHQMDNYGILLTVCRKSPSNEYTGNFQLHMPCQRKALLKMLGGWIRNQIHYSNPSLKNDYDNFHERVRYTDSPEYRKFRSFCYLRSMKISQVLTGMIWKSFKAKYGINEDELQVYNRIAYRMVQNSRHAQAILPELYTTASRMSPYMRRIFLSDLQKYNTAFTRYILASVSRNAQLMFPEEYNLFLRNAPGIYKHNRYNLMFPEDVVPRVLGNYMPQNRWQWYASRAACMGMNSYIFDEEHINKHISNPMYYDHMVLREFFLKLPKSDIGLWHYFKKAYHTEGPYNTKHIRHMWQIIADGARIYRDMRNNTVGVSFVPVEGSCMRMLRNAIYNHRQEQELTKKRRLAGENYRMPLPPHKLPDWMENIRLKTAHDMITAGIECEHCIGSYTNSHNIFIREGDICAEIDRDSYEVRQCFDKRDQITKTSEALRHRLNKELKKVRDLIMEAMSG